MLKSEKGVSLVTVIVTIIVMIVLISIVVNSSLDSVEETNIAKINNEMRNLKDAVNIRMTNYERSPLAYPLVGVKTGDEIFEYIRSIETLTSNEITNLINKIAEDYNGEKQDYYRVVGKSEAEKLGVEGIDSEHRYVVNYHDCEVYGPITIKIVNNGG